MPLSQPVAATEWRGVWSRINELIGRCNDESTKDPARLYYKPAHPPGTNHHFVEVQEGKLLDVSELPEASSPARVYPITFHRKSDGGTMQEIEGIESSGPDLNFEQGLREVTNRCAFMQFASTPENQANLSEPLWMAMITNACRFESSEQWIHAASEHHPRYSDDETEARIERYRNNGGPVTCQRIRELGFQGCPNGGCRRSNGEITKSPAGLYGWMFHRQLTATRSEPDQLPDEYEVEEFKVKPTGVFHPVYKDGELIDWARISSRVDVVALTRDQDSSNWGVELQLVDEDNIKKTWCMPKEMLAGAGDSYRASLMKMGATLIPSKQAKEAFAAYLVAARPQARALSVKQPGWFKDLFVLPDTVYGPTTERVRFQTNDPDENKRFSQKGTLESWRQNVARLCQGNSRAALAICIGLACPLLALLGEDNGGFHLRGNSSTGKTVCLATGTSVWGGASLIRTWNMTVNGFEGVATMHNDVLLPLDELGQADGKAAGEAAYMLGNGQGKSRATREGDARSAKRFRNLVLSSGEKSLSDLMAQSGQTVMAGQEVRMIEIAADAGCGYGAFENIHGARTSQEFAEQLKRATLENHGHAGRSFVQALTDPELQPRLIDRIKATIQRFVDAYVPAEAVGQVGRVGRRFGLVAAAGELCIELGILPWPEGEALDACRKCFMAWIDLRGGIGNHEETQAIAQVHRFIEMHGESRFTSWTEEGIEGIGSIDKNGLGKTIQRAGFRRVTEDGRTEYFILPEAYKSEVCSGMNAKYVTQVLADKGFLVKDPQGKPQVQVRLPGVGRNRVYHLKADFMGDGVSQEINRETAVRQVSTSGLSIKYIV